MAARDRMKRKNQIDYKYGHLRTDFILYHCHVLLVWCLT